MVTPSWVDPEQFQRQWEDWIKGVQAEAAASWEAGRKWHVATFSISGQVAEGTGSRRRIGDDVAGALEAITSVGWILDHAGYAYEPERERSHMMTQSATMQGNVVGVYVFRRPDGL